MLVVAKEKDNPRIYYEKKVTHHIFYTKFIIMWLFFTRKQS